MTMTLKRGKSSIAIAPSELHTILEPTKTEVMYFPDAKKMRSYRSMLYSVNRQGEYTYRTLRNPEDARELIVWRMK